MTPAPTKEQHPQPQQRFKFVPFVSAVESPFWVQYNRLKLETIRLSQAPLDLVATYDIVSSSSQKQPSSPQQPRLQCQENSLPRLLDHKATNNGGEEAGLLPNECVHARGTLLGYNTLEDFMQVDKNALLKNFFLDQFLPGTKEDDAKVVSSLNSFLLLTFADLKAHKAVYWFGFPALLPPALMGTCHQKLSEVYSHEQRLALAQQWSALRLSLLEQQPTGGVPPYFVWFPRHNLCKALSATVLQETDNDNVVFGFLDPSSQTDPGWPLRNLVAYLSIHLDMGGRQNVQILSYRPGRLRRVVSVETNLNDNNTEQPTSDDWVELDHVHDTSLLLTVDIPTREQYGFNLDNNNAIDRSNLKVAGWELNARGKPGPRSVQLRPLLDATHLAVQAADLNLKLMKWRMIPQLDVEKLQSLKVLLLGAGTLGCNVARTLLGWGVRHFCLVDYGRVNYSNPCRQPLFTLDDCTSSSEGGGGGKPKAEAAADALKQIAADVQTESVVLSIPMPGHPETRDVLAESVPQLDQLIQNADVVFLLTDTRESRWLPTVAAAAHGKLLMNAALGLDSWLVMRHGLAAGNENKLGCYFCNDVVAPENSTKNRTMDQQCTVTRPGLAPIASSMAVELMVALLHHPNGASAPAPQTTSSGAASNKFSPTVSHDQEGSSTTALGVVPHQIRGSLVSYTMMTPSVPAFAHCTGCHRAVIDAYRKDSVGLVYETCQSAQGQEYLENLTGLTEFRAQATAKLDEMMMEDDDVWGSDDE